MALISDKLIDEWFKPTSFVYKHYAYVFKNPIWDKDIPKGASLCPYFWTSMVVGVLFLKCFLVPLYIVLGAIGKCGKKTCGNSWDGANGFVGNTVGKHLTTEKRNKRMIEEGKWIPICLLVTVILCVVGLMGYKYVTGFREDSFTYYWWTHYIVGAISIIGFGIDHSDSSNDRKWWWVILPIVIALIVPPFAYNWNTVQTGTGNFFSSWIPEAFSSCIDWICNAFFSVVGFIWMCIVWIAKALWFILPYACGMLALGYGTYRLYDRWERNFFEKMANEEDVMSLIYRSMWENTSCDLKRMLRKHFSSRLAKTFKSEVGHKQAEHYANNYSNSNVIHFYYEILRKQFNIDPKFYKLNNKQYRTLLSEISLYQSMDGYEEELLNEIIRQLHIVTNTPCECYAESELAKQIKALTESFDTHRDRAYKPSVLVKSVDYKPLAATYRTQMFQWIDKDKEAREIEKNKTEAQRLAEIAKVKRAARRKESAKSWKKFGQQSLAFFKKASFIIGFVPVVLPYRICKFFVTAIVYVWTVASSKKQGFCPYKQFGK